MLRRAGDHDSVARIAKRIMKRAIYNVSERERCDRARIPSGQRASAWLMTKRTVRRKIGTNTVGSADRFVIRCRERAQTAQIRRRIFKIARSRQGTDLVGFQRTVIVITIELGSVETKGQAAGEGVASQTFGTARKAPGLLTRTGEILDCECPGVTA